ncbi:type IV secretion system DNA-binding domain-containing protein [Candidatus Protochlamydia amoebophila]|uniref:type IV secretion system DNA-binding domain-containing protein n=1 Tax=Candidatus Protochlamydia amoebophila TaxID=362787 RepID=UPI001BC93FAE
MRTLEDNRKEIISNVGIILTFLFKIVFYEQTFFVSITRSFQKLCDFVQETEVGFLVDINSEKTAASIHVVMSNFLTCFELLTNTEQIFSMFMSNLFLP